MYYLIQNLDEQDFEITKEKQKEMEDFLIRHSRQTLPTSLLSSLDERHRWSPPSPSPAPGEPQAFSPASTATCLPLEVRSERATRTCAPEPEQQVPRHTTGQHDLWP